MRKMSENLLRPSGPVHIHTDTGGTLLAINGPAHGTALSPAARAAAGLVGEQQGLQMFRKTPLPCMVHPHEQHPRGVKGQHALAKFTVCQSLPSATAPVESLAGSWDKLLVSSCQD